MNLSSMFLRVKRGEKEAKSKGLEASYILRQLIETSIDDLDGGVCIERQQSRILEWD